MFNVTYKNATFEVEDGLSFRFVVSLVMNTVVQFFLIFFWTIPVGVASAMVSFEKLEEKLPFLKNCKKIR